MKAGPDGAAFEGRGSGDRLIGGPGEDTLAGGRGPDVLSGKLGRDVFIYRDGDGRDRITDFQMLRDRLKIDEDLLAANVTNGDQLVDRYGTVPAFKIWMPWQAESISCDSTDA